MEHVVYLQAAEFAALFLREAFAAEASSTHQGAQRICLCVVAGFFETLRCSLCGLEVWLAALESCASEVLSRTFPGVVLAIPGEICGDGEVFLGAVF